MIVSSRKGSFNKSTTSRITNVGPKPSRRWWSSEQPDHQKKIVNGLTGDQTAREFWSQGPQPTKSDGRVRLQNQHFSHNSPCSHHHHHHLLSLPPNLLQSSWFLSNVIIEESIQSRERDITSQKRILVAYMYFIKQILNTVSNSAIANTIYHSEVFSFLKGVYPGVCKQSEPIIFFGIRSLSSGLTSVFGIEDKS